MVSSSRAPSPTGGTDRTAGAADDRAADAEETRDAEEAAEDMETSPSATSPEEGEDRETTRAEGEHALEEFIAARLAPGAATISPVPRALTDAALIRGALRRRGVEITTVAGQDVFEFAGAVIGGMQDSTTTLVNALARRVCGNAWLVKRHLQIRDLPVPEGRMHGPRGLKAACEHLREFGAPAVLKPVTGESGAGITIGLRTPEQLREAWPTALEGRRRHPRANPNLLLEAHHCGLDLRACVIDGRLVSAVVRVPIHVVGDGSASVAELLDRQAARRREHTVLAACTPRFAEEDLAPLGLRPDTVPAEGEVRVLDGAADLAAGGMPVDVTDEIADPLAELAVEAVGAMPDLPAGSVDLIAPRLDSAAGAVVVDVEPSPDLVSHHFPGVGAGRDVAGALAEALLKRASR